MEASVVDLDIAIAIVDVVVDESVEEEDLVDVAVVDDAVLD